MGSRATLIMLGAIAIVAIAATTAWVINSRSDAPHQPVTLSDSAPPLEVQLPQQHTSLTSAAPAPVVAPVVEPLPAPTKPTDSVAAPAAVTAPAPRQQSPAAHGADPQEPVVPEAVAREALSYVGADPVAEEVWYAAINDPQLSAKSRQNLIEDLNEDGFSDPHHPTADDLPLIVSRLQLIEAVAPDAADEVNAAAFAEAYKDLVNMFLRVTGS